MTTGQMVVLHLDTGHVLAAASVQGATATAEALTGGTHLRVRVPLSRVVTVPAAQLSVLSTDADLDVLAAPTRYRVVDAAPRVSHAGDPSPVDSTAVVGPPGQEFLVVWQVGSSVEVVRALLSSDGKVVLAGPTGATHAVVAVEGQPLRYTP